MSWTISACCCAYGKPIQHNSMMAKTNRSKPRIRNGDGVGTGTAPGAAASVLAAIGRRTTGPGAAWTRA